MAKKSAQNRRRSGTTTTTPVGRRFQKGQSGNPGGRPKGIAALVKSLVGPNGEKLIALLWVYASGSDVAIKRKFKTKYGPRHEVRLDAIKELRNMGFGVPKQPIELGTPDDAPLVFTLKLPDRTPHAAD